MSSDDIDEDIRRLNLQRAIKNEGTTLVLSIVLGLFGCLGIGHIYIGKTEKGVGLLIIGWILLGIGTATVMFGIGFIFLLSYLVVFIYHILDARDKAREFNDYYIRTKKSLW